MGTSKILIDGVGIDLTQDTVAANKMLSGIKAHDSNGDSVTGSIQTWQGTQKSGTKNIAANGTFDVSEYASVKVDTQNWDSDLPDEYQKVEYIETDSSHKAVINSGVQLEGDYGIFRVEAIFELNGWFENSSYSAVFSSTDHRYCIHYRHEGQENIFPEVGWNATTFHNLERPIPLNERLHCVSFLGINPLLNDENTAVSRSVIKYDLMNIPRIQQSVPSKTNTGYFGMSQPFGIFGRYNAPNSYSYRTGVKMYHLRVSQDGNLIRDYYPCYRKSDVAIGLYDVVENKFYLPENAATFIKGADVI